MFREVIPRHLSTVCLLLLLPHRKLTTPSLGAGSVQNWLVSPLCCWLGFSLALSDTASPLQTQAWRGCLQFLLPGHLIFSTFYSPPAFLDDKPIPPSCKPLTQGRALFTLPPSSTFRAPCDYFGPNL